MLSILQFRHANLSDYTHGFYILGNSYANPQVGRYKSWGRVRTILQDPVFRMDISNNWAASEMLASIPVFNYARSPWTDYITRLNLDMPWKCKLRDGQARCFKLSTKILHSIIVFMQMPCLMDTSCQSRSVE